MEHKRQYNMEKMLIAIAIFTSSFDIFGAINIFGYTFRVSQFVMMPIIVVYLIDCIKNRHMELPIGGNPLLIFCALQFIMLFRSPSIANGFQYFIWLLFSVLSLFSIVYSCERFFSFEWLFKIYLESFFYIAVFGLIQFFAYPFGIRIFLMQNWTDKLARINGFSYEPSYFATYMLLGFVTYSYLLIKKKDNLLKHMRLKSIVITIVMFLTTSRMGWLMMCFWIVLRICIFGISIIRGREKKTFLTSLIVTCFLLCFVFTLFYYVVTHFNEFKFLLNGTGLSGSSAHSFNGRVGPLVACIHIWLRNPLFGYGLGGSDAVLCDYMNIQYNPSTMNGMAGGLIIQLLVGSGIIGGIPIIVYFKRLYSQIGKGDVIIKALAWALAFEMINMLVSQSILRIYLWMHIAVLSCYIKNNKSDILKKSRLAERGEL